MISERIVLIKNYFDELERVRKEGTGKIRFYAKSMLMFSIINTGISLAEDMISRKNLQIPGTYADIFDILEKNRIISGKLCADMKLMIKLRNMIAHEYETFEQEDVEKLERKLDAIKELAKIAAGMEMKR